MKKILFLMCFAGQILYAQTDSTKTEEEEKAPVWEKTLNIGLNLSHTLNANAELVVSSSTTFIKILLKSYLNSNR